MPKHQVCIKERLLKGSPTRRWGESPNLPPWFRIQGRVCGNIGGLEFGPVRGLQPSIFLNKGPSSSERVLVLKFWSCLRPLVSWEGWVFSFRCSWRSKFSLLNTLQMHDLQWWSVVSEQLYLVGNWKGPVWAGSVITNTQIKNKTS